MAASIHKTDILSSSSRHVPEINSSNTSVIQTVQKLTIETVWKKSQTKTVLKETLEPQQWKEFRQQLRKLRTELLPFRVTDILKRSLKAKHPIPKHIEKQLEEKGKSAWLDALKAADYTLQKDIILAWERELVDEILDSEELKETLNLISEIRWVHGTNSATLAMLPFIDKRLFPTGNLLTLYGVAPMSGELDGGGMGRGGVNQKFISAESIRDFKRIWNDYASNISFAFNPEVFADLEKTFISCLDELFQNDPESWEWQDNTIRLTRMKQWCPVEFLGLLDKHQDQIQKIFMSKRNSLSPGETKILLALDYPIEELRKAFLEKDEKAFDLIREKFGRENLTQHHSIDVTHKIENPEDANRIRIVANRKSVPGYFYTDSYEIHYFISDIFAWRLLGLFDEANAPNRPFGQTAGDLNQVLRTISEDRIRSNEQFARKAINRLNLALNPGHNPVSLSESDRELIVNPFPMLFGSTKNEAILHQTGSELLVSGGVQLGEEIDIIFVRDDKEQFVMGWLKEHGLEGKVHVQSESKLKHVLDSGVPLFHAPHQIAGSNTLISSNDYKMQADAIEKSIRPLYNASYIHHGPIHMARVALLSAVAVEFYAERGVKSTISASNIPLIAALHDVGRKDDMGEDLWDQDSADIAAQWAQNNGKDVIEVETFRRGILEKDDKNSDLLAAKCVGAADCWDIIRTLYNPERDFRMNLLTLSKDFPDDPLILPLTREVMVFVRLTENKKIKGILSQSEDLYLVLFRVLRYAQHLTGKMTYLEGYLGHASILGVDFSSRSGLSVDLETAVQEYFECKGADVD